MNAKTPGEPGASESVPTTADQATSAVNDTGTDQGNANTGNANTGNDIPIRSFAECMARMDRNKPRPTAPARELAWNDRNNKRRPQSAKPAMPTDINQKRVWGIITAACNTFAAMPQGRRQEASHQDTYNLFRYAAWGGINAQDVEHVVFAAFEANGEVADGGEDKMRDTLARVQRDAERDGPLQPPDRPDWQPIDNGHTTFDAPDSDTDFAPPDSGDNDSGGGAPQLPTIRPACALTAGTPPQWLAQKRIPQGQVTVLIGDEGIGKSLFWVWLAVYVTTGKARPEFGIPERTPGVVLLVITEDAWTTDVQPRLTAAGADLANVRVLSEDEHGEGAPVFPRDFQTIRDWPEPLALIVVDAWLDTVDGRIKIADTQQARQALHPWKQLANNTGAAALLVAHTNRIASGTARDRMGATAALRQKARMLLLAQLDENSDLTVGPEKANGARIVNAARFDITAVPHFPPTDDHDGMVPVLTYDADADRTARQIHEDVFAAHKAAANAAKTASDPVCIWLRDAITEATDAGGFCWAAPAYDAAGQNGFSEKQVKRAKRNLGVISVHDGVSDRWHWRLPDLQGDR